MLVAHKTMATFTNRQYREDYQLTEGQAKKKVFPSFSPRAENERRN